MELALGTVQFGLPYGVAGRGEAVPEPEVSAILARAASLGIRMLDTAAAYGDIEARLLDLARPRRFAVVTKLAPLPAGLTDADVEPWAEAALNRAHERFGDALHAVMFHRAEDLLGESGERLWSSGQGWAVRNRVGLGVSCYDGRTLQRIRERFPVTIAQLPGNAFDQRLLTDPPDGAAAVELHLRSAFLQGLLLMPEAAAAQRVPAATHALSRWHRWLRDNELEALPAALGLVKGLARASHCVVGVDNAAQLEAVVAAWHATPALRADALCVPDPDVIDPRRWPARS